MTAALEDAALIASDGYVMPLRRWNPAPSADIPRATPRAIIIALHGFNDYSNAFAQIGPWLAARDIAVYAFDQRGFGATEDAGMWAGTETMIADLRAMIALVREANPGKPIYVLGESMGGAVALAAWAEAPLDVDGIILAGPAVWGQAGMPAYMKFSLWMTAHTIPWLRLGAEGLDIVASDNMEMLHALGRDPLVIKKTRVDAMWGISELMDAALDAAHSYDAPSLILSGALDEIVPSHATQMFLARLSPKSADRRKIAIYDGHYHMLLRDLEAETVWRDIESWITDPTLPLPSGAKTDFLN